MEFSQLDRFNPDSLTGYATAWDTMAKRYADAADILRKEAATPLCNGELKGHATAAAGGRALDLYTQLSAGRSEAEGYAKVLRRHTTTLSELKRRLAAELSQVDGTENLGYDQWTGVVSYQAPPDTDATPLVDQVKAVMAGQARAAYHNLRVDRILREADAVDQDLYSDLHLIAELDDHGDLTFNAGPFADTGPGDPAWVGSRFNPLVEYIFDEITTNRLGEGFANVKYLRENGEPSSLTEFAKLVGPGQEWDHKGPIRDMLGVDSLRDTYTDVPDTDYRIRGDLWSNIHYGYLGRDLGFPRDTLIRGADVADIVTNRHIEPADRITIQIGMDLYEKHPDGTLTEDDITEEIKRRLGDLYAADRNLPRGEESHHMVERR